MEESPEASLVGGDFELEDLSLYAAGNFSGLVAVDNASHFRMERVDLRAVYYLDSFMEIMKGDIHFRGRPIWTDLKDHKRFGLQVRTSSDIVVKDCRFICPQAAMAVMSGSRNIITMDCASEINYETYYGASWNGGCEENVVHENNNFGFAASSANKLYVADIDWGFYFGGDREIFTTDCGFAPYYGKVEGVDGVKTRCKEPLASYRWAADKPGAWKGYMAVLIGGRGSGQIRRLVDNKDRTLTLDRPWDIEPDASSVLSVTEYRRNFIFDNCKFKEAGAFQFYGGRLRPGGQQLPLRALDRALLLAPGALQRPTLRHVLPIHQQQDA